MTRSKRALPWLALRSEAFRKHLSPSDCWKSFRLPRDNGNEKKIEAEGQECASCPCCAVPKTKLWGLVLWVSSHLRSLTGTQSSAAATGHGPPCSTAVPGITGRTSQRGLGWPFRELPGSTRGGQVHVHLLSQLRRSRRGSAPRPRDSTHFQRCSDLAVSLCPLFSSGSIHGESAPPRKAGPLDAWSGEGSTDGVWGAINPGVPPLGPPVIAFSRLLWHGRPHLIHHQIQTACREKGLKYSAERASGVKGPM